MQIVIDIPEEVKEVFDKTKEGDLKGSYYDYNSIIGKAIQNGTPLPKGHGRLIDADEIETILHDRAFDKAASKQFYEIIWAKNLIHDAPTIIEADKEVEN